ncbi:hypothetical protein KR200_005220, partial [Drosophila serrata]
KALVEILRRNLRPEIRHEILNIQTDSISRLREICRRRECFLEEVKRDQIYKKGSPFKSHVYELLDGDNKYSESEFFVDEKGTVEICWNCRKEGHRNQDCTAPQKDRRPYTTVVILNRRIKGLMDTGASMSCVGGQFAQEILASDVPIKRVFSNISTAEQQAKHSRTNEKSRNTTRLKRFWKVTRDLNALRNSCKDRRPYTTVVILNRRIKGLMDTGASMSCLGGQFAQEILASDVPIKRVFKNISTADGSKQSIVGSIRSNIEYNGVI